VGDAPGVDALAFPISRDPPEGGTLTKEQENWLREQLFPISRDPPEGGTPDLGISLPASRPVSNF